MSPWRRGLSFRQPQTRSSPRLLDNDFNDDDSNHVAQQRLPAMPSSTAAGAARADSDTGERRRSLLLPETGLVWHSIYQGAGSCCAARMCEDTASQPVKRRYWQVACGVVACGGRVYALPVCVS